MVWFCLSTAQHRYIAKNLQSPVNAQYSPNQTCLWFPKKMAANFPYKILNDLTAKMKAAQDEAKIARDQIQAMKSVNTNPTMYSASQNTHLDNHQVKDLAREKEELEMQNNSYVEQLKDLTSRLNNLTVANNKWFLWVLIQ